MGVRERVLDARAGERFVSLLASERAKKGRESCVGRQSQIEEISESDRT